MDNTHSQKRYVTTDLRDVLLPEEYKRVEHSLKNYFHEVNIFSGLKLTDPEEYYTNNIRAPHVCWIGRCDLIGKDKRNRGNEWLYDKYWKGVPYDYFDLIALWTLTKKLKIYGTDNIFICSELIQRLFEYLDLLEYSIFPITPQEWQESSIMKTIIH